jgi:hypothetical protein
LELLDLLLPVCVWGGGEGQQQQQVVIESGGWQLGLSYEVLKAP